MRSVLHLGVSDRVGSSRVFRWPVKELQSAVASQVRSCQECFPQIDLHFDELDAAELQAALLGAQQKTRCFPR